MSDQPDVLALCRAALPGLDWSSMWPYTRQWVGCDGGAVFAEVSRSTALPTDRVSWSCAGLAGSHDTHEAAVAALRAAVVALRDECDRALGGVP